MSRGQVPTTMIEAALGLLLLMSVAFSFALGVPGGDASGQQLDVYASDALTILDTEPPRHGGPNRLSEVVASAEAFHRERDALHRRIARILPPNLMFRVETEYGAVGHRLPEDVSTGTATVRTLNGPLTLRVWYA
jgi:hypothetical protein